ncbi:unnamed protein product, partial [Polarella glacialis]
VNCLSGATRGASLAASGRILRPRGPGPGRWRCGEGSLLGPPEPLRATGRLSLRRARGRLCEPVCTGFAPGSEEMVFLATGGGRSIPVHGSTGQGATGGSCSGLQPRSSRQKQRPAWGLQLPPTAGLRAGLPRVKFRRRACRVGRSAETS